MAKVSVAEFIKKNKCDIGGVRMGNIRTDAWNKLTEIMMEDIEVEAV